MKKILFIALALVVPFFFTSCEEDPTLLTSDDFFIAFETQELILNKRPVAYELPHAIPLYVAAGLGDEVTVTVALDGDATTAEEGVDYTFTFQGFPQMRFPTGTGFFEGGINSEWGTKRDTVTIKMTMVSNSGGFNMGFKYGEEADSTSHHTLTLHFIDGSDLTFAVNDETGAPMANAVVRIGEFVTQDAGDYLFLDIPRGGHPIAVSSPGYWTHRRNININADVMSFTINMELERLATFTVVDEGGNAINDAVVRLRSTQPTPAQNFVFEAGEYSFNLPARQFTFTVNRAGFQEYDSALDLREGDGTYEVVLVAE